jgi:RecB family endonuclease NucS
VTRRGTRPRGRAWREGEPAGSRRLSAMSETDGTGAMRLIVARCEVRYTGRLTAVLPESTRLLMFKPDGSVLVHADAGG